MRNDDIATTTQEPASEMVSDRIFTAANVITFARLCLIPVSVWLLFDGQDIAATICFAVTAATDFLDGLVARRTNSVTRLGQFLDPLVDRLLIISAVIGLLVVGRLPIWIVVLVIIRDVYLVVGAGYLVGVHGLRVPVSYIGKVGMWFLCFGFAGLILNMPQLMGLGWCDLAYFPGFSADPYCAFIWLLYIGLVLMLIVTIVYTVRGIQALSQKQARESSDEGAGDGR